MVKLVALIKRKPGLSREEFVRHYEEVHAPLALKYLPGLKRYVRNYVIRGLGGREPDFDCITEFWFESWEDVSRVAQVLGDYHTQIGQIFLADEEQFMDRTSTVSFSVDERVSEQAGASGRRERRK